MQTIITKYHGPTNTKPSRVSAHCNGGKTMITFDHEGDPYRKAAEALVIKMKWERLYERFELHGGGMPDQSGEAFVWVEKKK